MACPFDLPETVYHVNDYFEGAKKNMFDMIKWNVGEMEGARQNMFGMIKQNEGEMERQVFWIFFTFFI